MKTLEEMERLSDEELRNDHSPEAMLEQWMRLLDRKYHGGVQKHSTNPYAQRWWENFIGRRSQDEEK